MGEVGRLSFVGDKGHLKRGIFPDWCFLIIGLVICVSISSFLGGSSTFVRGVASISTSRRASLLSLHDSCILASDLPSVPALQEAFPLASGSTCIPSRETSILPSGEKSTLATGEASVLASGEVSKLTTGDASTLVRGEVSILNSEYMSIVTSVRVSVLKLEEVCIPLTPGVASIATEVSMSTLSLIVGVVPRFTFGSSSLLITEDTSGDAFVFSLFAREATSTFDCEGTFTADL